MDYSKIGNFILEERKAKKLTQAQLADLLFVSEKTVSKWENGKGIPETSLLPKICEVFEISLNELLNGERIAKEKYVDVAEETIFQLQKQKEDHDKTLLSMEIVIGVLSIFILLSLTFIASFLQMEDWLRITLIVGAFVVCIIGCAIALRIEQVAGYYECRRCGAKYVPTYNQVLCAMHFGRTRYMKCPHCKKYSWNKKVVK